VESVRALSEREDAIVAQREQESKEKAVRLLQKTEERCREKVAETKAKCAALEEESRLKSEAYWEKASRKMQIFVASHQELKGLIGGFERDMKDAKDAAMAARQASVPAREAYEALRKAAEEKAAEQAAAKAEESEAPAEEEEEKAEAPAEEEEEAAEASAEEEEEKAEAPAEEKEEKEAEAPAEEKEEKEEPEEGTVGYIPGEYTAKAQGYGEVTMTAEFNEERIVSIGLDVSNETSSIGGAASKKLIRQCLREQSPEIDGVSGATLTTNAVKECLADCISQASARD